MVIIIKQLCFIHLAQEGLNILFHHLDTLDVLDCVAMRVEEDSVP